MDSELLTLTPFLNREAGEFDAAGWFQLVPKGSFPIARREADGQVRRYVQVIDDRAVEQIVADFNRRQTAQPGFRLLIDYDHFSHDTEKSSEAAAWVNAVEARADGVWAKAEWSDAGAAAIKNRRYRYLSPVWFPHQTERISDTSFRPIAVSDAGLTNKPNLGDALQPFWNREDSFPANPSQSPVTQTTHIMKDRLLIACALALTATDDQIVAAVEGFKNRAAQADALQTKLTALETEHAAFKNRHTALLNAAVERTLEEHKGIITEEAKPAWKNRLEADFDGTVALLKGIKPAAAAQEKKPLHQSGKAAAVAAKQAAIDGAEPFMNRVRAVATERKLSEAAAIVAVASEEPALYATYRDGLVSA